MFLQILSVILMVTVLGTSSTGSLHFYKLKDKKLTVSCNATSEENVTWYFGVNALPSDEKYTINNGELTINKLSYEDAGIYTCKPAGSSPDKNVTLASVPLVTIDPKKSLTVVAGDKAKMSCLAIGRPLPEVTWTNEDGVDLSNQTETVDMLEEFGRKVTLTIAEAGEEQAGLYTCNARTVSSSSAREEDDDVKEAEAEVRLRVKDKLAALWPFLGICAEVALLCIIIFCYEHRRMKQSKAEMEADDKNNTKKSGDQSPSEVRQRK